MFRFATLNDVSFILSLEETLFPSDIRSSKASIIHSIKSSTQLVIIQEQDNDKIGCAILFVFKKSCRIYSIAIAQEFQHNGYGKQLMQHIIDFANSSKRNILLEVRKNNESLISFYTSFGFQTLYELHNYYGLNEHGLKMIKSYTTIKTVHKNVVVVDRILPWLE